MNQAFLRLFSMFQAFLLVSLLLLQLVPAHAAASADSKTYLIGFKKQERAKVRAIQRSSVEPLTGQIVVAELTESEKQAMLEDENVAYIEEDSETELAEASLSPSQSQQVPWGVEHIGAAAAHSQQYKGQRIKIGVLDTGISAHPDLEIKGGVSYIEGEDDFGDQHGHGTAVAGVIAARDNDFGIVGVAPEAELYAIKVLDKKGHGTYSSMIQGIEWAIQNRMNILSISAGGYVNSRALHDQIKRANEHGILVIAAAGNRGLGEETELFPAQYAETISVGAVDREDQRADFSSVGKELDLMAPGVDIRSTAPGGDFQTRSGTSLAAPHVAGAAAVIWSAKGNISSTELRDLLTKSATPLGESRFYGKGLVHLEKALGQGESSAEIAALLPSVSELKLAQGESHPLKVTAKRTDGSEQDVTKRVSYAVQDEAIAKVRAAGLVSAVGPGETKVTGELEGHHFEISVTVTPLEPLRPLAGLDSPENGEWTSGLLNGKGWYLDPAGVANIHVLVDGAEAGEAQYGQPRPDIAAKYPAYGNPNAGFTFQLDTQTLASGAHTLAVIIENAAGEKTTIAGRAFYVGETPLPEGLQADVQKLELAPGDSHPLKISLILEDRSVQDVTQLASYTSSDPGVATVSETGVVQAVGVGSTNLTVTYEAKTLVIPVQVQVKEETPLPARGEVERPANNATVAGQVLVEGWYLDPAGVAKIEVQLDGTRLGDAQYGLARRDIETAYPDYRNPAAGFQFLFQTSAGQEGAHVLKVTAVSNDGTEHVLAERAILVEQEQPTTSISAAPEKVEVARGKTQQLRISAVLSDQETKDVTAGATYAADHPHVASISPSGMVTGLEAGQTTITVHYQEHVLTVPVTVREAAGFIQGGIDTPPDNATISGVYPITGWYFHSGGVAKVEVLVDGILQGEAAYGIPRPEVEITDVSSPNHDIGYQFDLDTGKLQEGTHTLSVRGTGQDGTQTMLGERKIHVVPLLPAKSLQANSTALSLTAGKTHLLVVKAILDDESEHDVSKLARYTVDNLSVAKVNADGLVTAITPGTANLTITYGQQSLSIPITVTEAGPLSAMGELETPVQGAVIEGTSTIAGWFLATTPITRYEVLVDGTKKGEAKAGIARPDIALLHPEYANSHAGFSLTLEGSDLPAGEHTVAVVAIDPEGKSHPLPEKRFVIGKQPPILRLQPQEPTVTLPKDSSKKLTISALLTEQTTKEITGEAQYTAEKAEIIHVSPLGVVTGLQVGQTNVVASYGGQSVTIPVTVTETEAGSTQPKGQLELPFDRAVIGGVTTVQGWLLDPSGIAKVEVLVDGQAVGTAEYGEPRPDIAAMYPHYRQANAGFRYQWDTLPFAEGTHKLTIRTTNQAGQESLVLERDVVIGPVAKLTANLTQITLEKDKTVTFQLTATHRDNSTKDVTAEATYAFENPALAKIEASTGLITGLMPGNTQLRVSYAGIVQTYPVRVQGDGPSHGGEIDTPSDNEVISGNYLVTGWFLPEGELDKIEILLDETVLGEALYGTERPDVLLTYPGSQGAKPGFSYGLRAEEQPKGTHKLTVRITEKDGKQTNLERTVTIVEAITEENRYWLQFSKEQGKHNWSYLEAKEERYTELVWNQESEQWKSPQGETIIGNTWMHIGGSDPVIRWEAPRSGKIHVGGWASMLEGSEGDGVNLRLLKNDTQIWPSAGWQSIAFNDQVGVELAQELEVEAGDKLYFQAQAKETEVGDSFKWTPEIDYLSTNIPDNAAPRVYLTTPVTGKVIDQVNGQDVITLSGWVMDPNLGDRVSLWYQIDEGEVHQIASFLASENASAFLYHAPVQDLKPDDVYSLKVWATDQKQGLSPVQQVDFTLDMRAQAKEKDPVYIEATWKSPANNAEFHLGDRIVFTWDYSPDYPFSVYGDKITSQELTIYITQSGQLTPTIKEKLSAKTRSYEMDTSMITKNATVEARLRTVLNISGVPSYVEGSTIKRNFKILYGNTAPIMESTEFDVIYSGNTGLITYSIVEKDATDKLVARKLRVGWTPGGNEVGETMENLPEDNQAKRTSSRYQFPITKDMLFRTVYWTAQAQDNRGAWSEPQVYSARLVDHLPYLAVYTPTEKRIIDLKETFTLDGTYSRLQAGDTLTGTIYPATYAKKTTTTTGSAGYWSMSWLGQELGEGTYTNTEVRSASGRAASYSGVLVVERKPGAPVIVKTEPTKNAITVYWNPSPGASTYQIRLDNHPLARDVGNVTSYTFSGLQPGRAYTIMLWAYSPSGISSYPASISVETLPAEENFTLLQENSPIRMYYPAEQAKYFKLTAKTSGTYQFTLTNDSSSLAAGKIAVFRSASLQTPDQIASGENGSVSAALVAGKTYYLSVQSRSSLYATLLAKASGEAIVFNQAKELTIPAGQSVELSMNAVIPGTYRTVVQLKNPGSKYPTVAVLSNGTLVSPKQKPSEAEAVYELASGSYTVRLTNNDTTALSLSFTVFAPLAGGTLYEYVYDANNRITAIKENGANSVTFTHDENGNLLKSVKQAVSPQPKATALKLDSDRVDVSSGGSASIQVTATLENGSQVDVTSQVTVIVENPSVAYISNGRVYAVNGGTTQARLYYGGQTKTLTITVSAPAISLSSISLSPAQTTLAEGQIQRVYATAYYTDGSSKDINSVASFSSSSPSVAQVSSQGVVTGIAPGTATITASYNGKSASAQVTVQGAYLLGLKASPAQLSLAAGNKGQLSIYAQYSNGVEENVSAKAQYTSGNPAIASVDGMGGVVATAAGTTTIQVTYGAKTLSVPVTVTGNVVTLQTISVRPESVSVKKGATQQLEVKATYSDNKVTDVTSQASYQVAQPAIATVSATGLITGAAVGSTTVTVSFGGKTVSVPVQVTEAQEPVQSLTVTPVKLELLVGKAQTLQVTATYKDGKEENVSQKATYTSSNATIASVSSSGVVTALAEGTAQITVQYGGKSISMPVTGSVVSLQTLAVRPESVSMKKGATQQLEVKATYSDNKVTDVTSQATYQIAQPAIATVSATGLITGVAVGSTTVTVTFGGKTVSVPVQITEAREPVQSLTVTPAQLDLLVGKTQTLQVTATYKDGKTADVSKQVTYLSQDSSIATVQPDGFVTAVKAGSTSLTVTYEGVSVNVPVVVTAENAVVDIKIVPEAITLLEHATKQLAVKAVHADGTESDMTDKAQYTVDDPSIASVSTGGLLTAKKAGTATLAAAFSGKQRSVAVKVSDPGVQLQSLSAGMAYTQILRADGSLWATGQNEHGQLGNGTMQNQTTPVPVMVDVVVTQLETTANLVEMNAYESKPLKVTATYANGHAQDVTDQVVYESSQPEILQVDQHGVMTSGEMGGKASVVIRYYDQQLTIPVQVKGIPRSVQYISAGMNYTLIMTDDGSFWATGQNESGQLGDGTMQNRNSPIKIIGQEPGRVTK